jgi:antirestriction protein ArdC
MRDHSGLLEDLQAGIAELTTSEKWRQYLDVQSRFYSYSPNNVMLIQLQNPYATRVAGYRAWQALDHQVMAQETALRILAPMRYKKDEVSEGEDVREIRGFKLVPVFDISQTEGPDLPDVVSKLEGLAPEGVFDRLTEFAHSIGFRVERPESLESGANGDTTHSSGLIRVVSSNSEAQQAKTLAHEIGHALLHDPEYLVTKDLSRGLKELEAESTAYVICTALGMDTSDYSFGYVLGWTGGAPDAIEDIKESTGRIQKAATAVLRNFEAEAISTGAEQAAGIEVALVRGVPTRAIGERSMDPETILSLSGQLVEEQTQLQSEGDEASSSDDLVEVNSFEPSRRNALGGNLQRPSSMGFVVFDVAVESDQHLDV